jgi:hypothetical protein
VRVRQVTAEAERRLQDRTAGDYYGALVSSYLCALGGSLLLQEGAKVFFITLVSPQLMPNVVALQRMTLREGIRYCARGAITSLYLFLRAV